MDVGKGMVGIWWLVLIKGDKTDDQKSPTDQERSELFSFFEKRHASHNWEVSQNYCMLCYT